MSKDLLPTDDEVAALMPGPGSITWRRGADARTLIAAGYALVLQVAHPTVGAGVAQHSNYREDPWGRLFRTLDFTSSLIYAEPPMAAAVARNVRSMHRRIRGLRPDGVRYHALEPEAFAWVHATLFGSIVSAHARFGSPLAPDEEDRFWFEWRRLGRLLGLRERDLPETLGGYREYFDSMVEDVLEDNESVRGVIASLTDPKSPPLPRYAAPVWHLTRLPAARAMRLATIGLLPEVLRERLGLSLSRRQQLELSALGLASRATTPVLPRRLREFGPSYLRWREEETTALATELPQAA